MFSDHDHAPNMLFDLGRERIILLLLYDFGVRSFVI